MLVVIVICTGIVTLFRSNYRAGIECIIASERNANACIIADVQDTGTEPGCWPGNSCTNSIRETRSTDDGVE